jgi:hypothetical protein
MSFWWTGDKKEFIYLYHLAAPIFPLATALYSWYRAAGLI